MSDHDTDHVVWVGEGRCSEALSAFFRGLPGEVRDAIENVTMDMSQADQKAVRENLPNAEIAFDHFHLANSTLPSWRTKRSTRSGETSLERLGLPRNPSSPNASGGCVGLRATRVPICQRSTSGRSPALRRSPSSGAHTS